MEFALLKFNDELKINIKGLGLVPLVSLYPELWELYLKKLSIHSDYLDEVIKELKGEDHKVLEVFDELKQISNEIEMMTINMGLPLKISVYKIAESGKDYIVKDVFSKEEMYVDAREFNSHLTNEFAAKKCAYTRKLTLLK